MNRDSCHNADIIRKNHILLLTSGRLMMCRVLKKLLTNATIPYVFDISTVLVDN